MLKRLFVSTVRVNILKLLLSNSNKGYHVRAIVRAVDAEINAVRRELENLYKIELVTRRQSSNRIYYKINPEHKYFYDLLSLFSKDTGFGHKIIRNKKKIGEINFAVLSNKFLKGIQSTALEVDFFIVGNIDKEVTQKIIKDHENITDREINFAFMSKDEFVSRKRTKDSFVMTILSQGNSILMGDPEEFYSLF